MITLIISKDVKSLSIMDFDDLVYGNVMALKMYNYQQINENLWQAVDYAPCDELNVLDV